MKSEPPPSMPKITWAPVYFEPLPGSGERITIAVCALGEGSEPQCISSIDPPTISRVFPESKGFMRDAIEMVRESLVSYSRETKGLNGWVPPFEGVELGTLESGTAPDLPEVLSAALQLSSFLYRQEPQQSKTQSPRNQNWASSVKSLLIEKDRALKQLIGARVCLANVDVPSEFYFLSPNYAANLITFPRRAFKQSLVEARAKAWSLDQLDQAPSLLFRPERRELLAGMPRDADHKDSSRLQDCIEELKEEALRRRIEVLQFESAEQTADHIIDRHYAMA